MFPHHKVDEHPNKKPNNFYYSHKREESDDKNVVAIVKSVPQFGCVSQDSGALVSQGRKSRGNRCRKSWDRFEEYDSFSRLFVKQVSRKRKDQSNASQNSSLAKLFRYEI